MVEQSSFGSSGPLLEENSSKESSNKFSLSQSVGSSVKQGEKIGSRDSQKFPITDDQDELLLMNPTP